HGQFSQGVSMSSQVAEEFSQVPEMLADRIGTKADMGSRLVPLLRHRDLPRRCFPQLPGRELSHARALAVTGGDLVKMLPKPADMELLDLGHVVYRVFRKDRGERLDHDANVLCGLRFPGSLAVDKGLAFLTELRDRERLATGPWQSVGL